MSKHESLSPSARCPERCEPTRESSLSDKTTVPRNAIKIQRAASSQLKHRSSKLPKPCNPLIPRLKYLTEIPPSPPVDLLPLRLIDEDGAPIVHPLRMDPNLLGSGEIEEITDSPFASSSRSDLSTKDNPEARMASLPLMPRPPLALIRRHVSAASRNSSNNSSSSYASSSPLAGPPTTPMVRSFGSQHVSVNKAHEAAKALNDVVPATETPPDLGSPFERVAI